MNRVAARNTQSTDASKVEVGKALPQQGRELQSAQGGHSAGGGFNLTQVPVRPAMQTGVQIQCCAKDGEDCSCPKCRKAAKRDAKGAGNGEEDGVTSDVDAQQSEVPAAEASQADTAASQTDTETSQEQAAEPEAAPAGGLIVEDSVEEVKEGQMKKTPFLQQLREAICNAIGPVLAKKGQTTEGCPYLNYWFDSYQNKSATDIEQTLKRYAPDTANAKTASEYISIVVQRALQAAEKWASTGAVPDDLPTALPAAASSPGEGDAGSEGAGQEGAVQAKAKSGGVRGADDPRAIRQELGEGHQLPSDVRGRMESAFGADFSHVRTHTDGKASDVSSRVNARAFTVGNHMAFGNGEYKPGTMLGDALIAHELAHTIQQSGAGAAVDKMEMGSSGYEALEADADHAAAGAVGLLWKGNEGGMRGMGQKALSRLRSGLTLQRCCTETRPLPTVTLTELKPPAPLECGGMEWPVRFGLSGAKKDTEGWIVQRIDEDFDVKDCDGTKIDVLSHTQGLVNKKFSVTGKDGVQNVVTGPTDPKWYPFTEAWSVKGGKVFKGSTSTPHDKDTYRVPPFGPNTKGSVAITGSVDYFDCADLPSGFDTGKEPSVSLPIARPPSVPTSAGSGAKAHNLKVEWNCCPGAKPEERMTKVVSKDP